MSIIGFTVHGPPVPKGRPRLTRGGHAFTPGRTKAYERRVALMALQAVCWLPEGRPSWPTEAWYSVCLDIHTPDRRIPDVDNVAKAIIDGAQGVLWENDRRVIRIIAELKTVCSVEPRVDVSVAVIDAPTGWEHQRSRQRRSRGTLEHG